MAGDTIPFALRSMDTGVTPVAGVRSAQVTAPTVVAKAPTAASAIGGVAAVCVQKYGLEVAVVGTNPAALIALIGIAAANCVLHVKAGDGTNQKETIKNVVWHTPSGPFEVRDPDSGGMTPMWGLLGTAQWGDSDTPALMWVSASDA